MNQKIDLIELFSCLFEDVNELVADNFPLFLGIFHAGQRTEEDFAGRLLPFDSDAATHFADIAAARRSLGQPISQTDAQIAAIARSRAAAIATRNQRDFADCGIALVDPWG